MSQVDLISTNHSQLNNPIDLNDGTLVGAFDLISTYQVLKHRVQQFVFTMSVSQSESEKLTSLSYSKMELLAKNATVKGPLFITSFTMTRILSIPSNYVNRKTFIKKLVSRSPQNKGRRLGRKTFVSPMMGCWRFSDPRILGAVAASQQTFFIVSGSHSS